ncbi:MAG: hypothetical protein J07HN6_01455 [Halonotius sp. J07HN6]|nr:MAG: hypothetical protein J07HN6_01455 [Halonotius sp. J07HN6]
MLFTVLTMSAEQQLILKLQSVVVMTVFGLVVGLLLRPVMRALVGDAFTDTTPSRQSPWR